LSLIALKCPRVDVELQKKIRPFLRQFFPKIQLIVSTHSPFVLTSLNDAVIYDLEYDAGLPPRYGIGFSLFLLRSKIFASFLKSPQKHASLDFIQACSLSH
jgi:predicted ATPase